MKTKLKLFGIFMGILFLVGCGDVNKENGVDTEKTEQSTTNFIETISNDGTPVETETLKLAYVSDSPFKGILNGFLYGDANDFAFVDPFMGRAFKMDDDYKIVLDSDETPIKVSIDIDAKTITYKINPKFKWSNGEPVTTKDIVKTYEIFANQDYIISSQSIRFNDSMRRIVGIEEYNQGKAKTISGLEVIDDANMIIHLKEIGPEVYWGGNTAPEFVNAKQFEGIPMKKVIEAPALRRNPLSYGPYVIKEIVPGEKIVYEANPYYYKGEAKIKRIEMEILPSSQQVAAIKAGKYDIVYETSLDVYPELKELDNIDLLAREEPYMRYLLFRMGKWDGNKNTVITDPNSKMYDINLRKAMAYAIDNDAIGKQFYDGLAKNATSTLSPLFPSLHNPEVKGYTLDMEKAKKLLDDAGYKDVTGDGLREDKNGKPLKIRLAMMSGGETAEPLSQYYLQQWREIGLDVSLVNDRLLDFNNFYDRLEKDDPEIDVAVAAVGFGSDPQQVDFLGKGTSFNFSRYTSPTLEAAMMATVSQEALDPQKLIEAYHNYDKVMMDEIPIVPQINRYQFLPVNKRVKYFEFSNKQSDFDMSKVEVIAKEPVVSKKN